MLALQNRRIWLPSPPTHQQRRAVWCRGDTHRQNISMLLPGLINRGVHPAAPLTSFCSHGDVCCGGKAYCMCILTAWPHRDAKLAPPSYWALFQTLYQESAKYSQEKAGMNVCTLNKQFIPFTKNTLLMVLYQSSTYFGCLSNRLATILPSNGLFPSP